MSKFSENYRQIAWGDHSGWRRQRRKDQGSSGPFILPDISEFVSPVNYERISSRSALREHEKRHNVIQCGELKTPQDFSNSEKRSEAFNEKHFETAYRIALEKKGLL